MFGLAHTFHGLVCRTSGNMNDNPILVSFQKHIEDNMVRILGSLFVKNASSIDKDLFHTETEKDPFTNIMTNLVFHTPRYYYINEDILNLYKVGGVKEVYDKYATSGIPNLAVTFGIQQDGTSNIVPTNTNSFLNLINTLMDIQQFKTPNLNTFLAYDGNQFDGNDVKKYGFVLKTPNQEYPGKKITDQKWNSRENETSLCFNYNPELFVCTRSDDASKVISGSFSTNLLQELSKYDTYSSYMFLMIYHLYSKINYNVLDKLWIKGIPPLVSFGFCRPNCRYIGDMIMYMASRGGCVERGVAFPRRDVTNDYDQQVYRIKYKVYMVTKIIWEENFVRFNGILFSNHFSGEHTTFDKPVESHLGIRKRPECFSFMVKLGYSSKRPPWLDLSGGFLGKPETRHFTIPNWRSLNIVWGIEPDNIAHISAPYEAPAIPEDLKFQASGNNVTTLNDNFICTWEPYMEYTEKGWSSVVVGLTRWKSIERNFMSVRYQGPFHFN
jgi:hypothetical protein